MDVLVEIYYKVVKDIKGVKKNDYLTRKHAFNELLPASQPASPSVQNAVTVRGGVSKPVRRKTLITLADLIPLGLPHIASNSLPLESTFT